ncbi:MAG TPA: amidohydrolase family protein [Phycisphaerae bacterium]|nr:amidohydrolase family protein [Phycisphaerae bacterium]
MLDILIEGAKVYDGTGSPWFRADVGIRDGRIAKLGVVKDRARRRIDAAGLALCPGFVDAHTHADDIVKRPAAENLLRQGVTTVVSGNCGDSELPIRKMLDRVQIARPAINYATLVGHGAIRKQAMGMAGRGPTRGELAQMRRLAERAMREGAVGISTGLFYVPGAYARLEELVEVSKVVAAHGGVYASHKRSAGGKVLEAIREAAAVGRKAGIAVEISHLKLLHRRGRTTRDRAEEVLAAVARHREGGVDIAYDTYPYTATNTTLSSVAIPPRVSVGGRLVERLKDAAVRRRIRGEVAGRIAWIGGPGKITVVEFPPDRTLEGKTLADVARARGRDATDAAMDLIVEGEPWCIFHALRPRDVDRFVCDRLGMIASDGGVADPRRRVVHPRNYGTFPRVLREYVRDRRLMSFPQAIRKMTSMPAARFAIPDRGIVARGMIADLVVFDPRTVGDRATFDKPHANPVGIRHVIVSGQVAFNGRSVSRERWGVVLRGR